MKKPRCNAHVPGFIYGFINKRTSLVKIGKVHDINNLISRKIYAEYQIGVTDILFVLFDDTDYTSAETMIHRELKNGKMQHKEYREVFYADYKKIFDIILLNHEYIVPVKNAIIKTKADVEKYIEENSLQYYKI